MESLTLQTSATSLSLHNDKLFIGSGNELFVDNARVALFRDSSASIHGLKSLKNHLLAFGGKLLIVFDDKLKIVRRWEAEDWITDVLPIPDSEEQMYVLTAHNVLLHLDQYEVKRRVLCPEKCILYSGLLVGGSKPIILAGTVFQELVIWTPDGDEEGCVVARLKGHEGVLFSITCNVHLGLICSTSDDRTARLWRIKDKGLEKGDVEFFSVLRGYHTARVFRSNIVSIQSGSIVVTIGEDSLIGIWSVDGHLQAALRHGDGPIWSLLVDKTTETEITIYTGGGDAAVRKQTWRQEGDVMLQFADFNDSVGADNGDYPKVLSCVGEHLIVLTDGGKVFKVENSQSWSLLFEDADLKHYGLIAVEPNTNTLAFATLDGQVIVYQSDGKICKHKVHRDKIFALQYVSETQLLIGGNEVMKLCVADHHNDHLTVLQEYQLPKNSQWFTCALVVQHMLIIGDRNGSVHAVDLESSNQPMQSLTRIHGRLGVGDIKSFDGLEIISAGRDGIIRVFSIHDKMLNVKSATKIKMPWPEKISRDVNNKTIIQGFHSSKFIVYCLEDDAILLETECGGSQRSWTSTSIEPDGELRFSFIKERRCFQKVLRIQTSVIKTPFHAKELSCCHHFVLDSKHLIATSGEDTLIKIWEWNADTFQHWKTLTGHISSVKSIKTCRRSLDEVILVSAGGRAQLKIWQISSGGCVKEIASHLLKGNDKFRKKKTWKSHDLIPDAETRYMDIDLKLAKDTIQIYAACSDGVLRVFEYEASIRLISESSVHSHALQKVIVSEEFILLGSTDGLLRKLDPIKLDFEGHKTVAHQSGINGLDARGDIVVTGGDDCSISVATPGKFLHFKEKHAAQICGARILQWTNNKAVIATCSIDQRVSVWTLIDGQLSLKYQAFSHVPQIQAMTSYAFKDRFILCVVGVGLQMFAVDCSDLI